MIKATVRILTDSECVGVMEAVTDAWVYDRENNPDIDRIFDRLKEKYKNHDLYDEIVDAYDDFDIQELVSNFVAPIDEPMLVNDDTYEVSIMFNDEKFVNVLKDVLRDSTKLPIFKELTVRELYQFAKDCGMSDYKIVHGSDEQLAKVKEECHRDLIMFIDNYKKEIVI